LQHRCEVTVRHGTQFPDAVGKMVPQNFGALWESNIAMTAKLKKGKSATVAMSNGQFDAETHQVPR